MSYIMSVVVSVTKCTVCMPILYLDLYQDLKPLLKPLQNMRAVLFNLQDRFADLRKDWVCSSLRHIKLGCFTHRSRRAVVP